MTPWHLHLCKRAADKSDIDRHNSMAWFMWHAAALFRSKAKKLPDMSLFKVQDKQAADKKKPVAGINEGAIMAWLAGAKAAHDAKKDKK